MNKFFDKVDNILKTLCEPKWKNIRNTICMLLSLLSMLSVFLLMFNPICTIYNGEIEINAWEAFGSIESTDEAVRSFFFIQLACGAIIVLCIVVMLMLALKALVSLSNENVVASKTKSTVVLAVAVTAIYTVLPICSRPSIQYLEDTPMLR